MSNWKHVKDELPEVGIFVWFAYRWCDEEDYVIEYLVVEEGQCEDYANDCYWQEAVVPLSPLEREDNLGEPLEH